MLCLRCRSVWLDPASGLVIRKYAVYTADFEIHCLECRLRYRTHRGGRTVETQGSFVRGERF